MPYMKKRISSMSMPKKDLVGFSAEIIAFHSPSESISGISIAVLYRLWNYQIHDQVDGVVFFDDVMHLHDPGVAELGQ